MSNLTSFELAALYFDRLTAKEKADFMRERIVWACTCDMEKEIEVRNKYMTDWRNKP